MTFTFLDLEKKFTHDGKFSDIRGSGGKAPLKKEAPECPGFFVFYRLQNLSLIHIWKDADFFIINDRYEVQETWVEGRRVFTSADPILTNEHFSQFCQKLD